MTKCKIKFLSSKFIDNEIPDMLGGGQSDCVCEVSADVHKNVSQFFSNIASGKK